MNIGKNVLLKIKDDTMEFELTKITPDKYEIKISLIYRSFFCYQKNLFRIIFDKQTLIDMIHSLVNGQKYSYGNSSIWQSNKIYIKKPYIPVQYREIWLYRRIFVLGLAFKPAMISEKIITALKAIEV